MTISRGFSPDVGVRISSLCQLLNQIKLYFMNEIYAIIALTIITILGFCLGSPNIVYFLHKRFFIWTIKSLDNQMKKSIDFYKYTDELGLKYLKNHEGVDYYQDMNGMVKSLNSYYDDFIFKNIEY